MRFAGMFLVGFGITLLIPSGIALGYAHGLAQVIGFLVCTALIPVPMIISGIAIIRSAENTGARRIKVPDRVVDVDAADPVGGILARMRRFDLNRLNWVGWLLLLATFGFVIAEAAVLAMYFGDQFKERRIEARAIGLGALLLAIGFFAGVRWLLQALGVSIYR
jgi:nitrate/nitrite transporter NarK